LTKLVDNPSLKIILVINKNKEEIMEYVYWIKRKEFNDPYTEGYIGISNNPIKRFVNHKTRNDNPHLKRALEIYNDIEIIILHECNTREEVVALEKLYRPDKHQGWNIIPGGDTPPRNHLTDDVRAKISNTLKSKNTCPYNENTHSPEAIEKRKKSMVGRKWFYNPQTNESVLSHNQPTGWSVGRKLIEENVSNPKTRGVDYICNTKNWRLFINNDLVFEGNNVRMFLKNAGYISIYPNLTKSAKENREYYSKKHAIIFKLVKINE
jgi:predicted GIY-YIG superfamily endonuclease